MKYAYAALLSVFLFLALNSRTDPFDVKHHIEEALPVNMLQATSGQSINARIIPDPSSFAEDEIIPTYTPANVALKSDFDADLCSEHAAECEQVKKWLSRNNK